MPNWAENVLYVRGEEDELLAFDEAFKGKPANWPPSEFELIRMTGTDEEKRKKWKEDYEKLEPSYCFNALMPVPEEVLEKGFSGKRPEEYGLFDGINDPDKWYDGYTWCITHWGTKWDVYGNVTCDHAWNGDDFPYSMLCYRFATAWGPPMQFLSHVAGLFKNLRFIECYAEPGCGGYGQVDWIAGTVISDVQFEDRTPECSLFVMENFGYDPEDMYEDEDEQEEAMIHLHIS